MTNNHRFHGSRGVWRKLSFRTPLSIFLGRNFANNFRLSANLDIGYPNTRRTIPKHRGDDSWPTSREVVCTSLQYAIGSTMNHRLANGIYVTRSDSILIIIRVPIQGNVSLNRDWYGWLITGKISTNNHDVPWEICRIYQIGSHGCWINARLAE